MLLCYKICPSSSVSCWRRQKLFNKHQSCLAKNQHCFTVVCAVTGRLPRNFKNNVFNYYLNVLAFGETLVKILTKESHKINMKWKNKKFRFIVVQNFSLLIEYCADGGIVP